MMQNLILIQGAEPLSPGVFPGQAPLRASNEPPTAPTKSDVKSEDINIRPFRVHVPEATLLDLRQRLAATRLPEQETVADQSQGVQLATIKELVRH